MSIAVLQGKGKILPSQDDSIIFDRVPIVSPNGDILLKSLSFKITPGVSGREDGGGRKAIVT